MENFFEGNEQISIKYVSQTDFFRSDVLIVDAFVMPIIEFLKGFSYFGIMLALSFEFIPAELVLPLAGYWVYQGDFNYYLVVLAGTIGGVIGPITLYCLGRFGGRRLCFGMESIF